MANEGVWNLLRYKAIWEPSNTAKAQIALTQAVNGFNKVYTYCDFTKLNAEVTNLWNMAVKQQIWGAKGIIPLVSRVAGAYLGSVPKLNVCIEEG